MFAHSVKIADKSVHTFDKKTTHMKTLVSKHKRTLMGIAALALSYTTNAQIAQYTVSPWVDQAKLYGFSGDGGSSLLAKITMPYLGAFNSTGKFFFCDAFNYRVRSVTTNSIINTEGGTGVNASAGDGGAFSAAQLKNLSCVAVGPNDNLFVSEGGRIRKVNSSNNIINTIAGTGIVGSTGDGGQAINAQINCQKIKVDNNGNIYFNEYAGKIRKINAASGIITTYAGTGVQGNTGDGGPATAAQITVTDFDIDNNGNLYLIGAYRVRKIDAATGIITTVVGNGTYSNTGDNGPGINATTTGMVLECDNNNNVLIADWDNSQNINTVRKYTPGNGQINTIIHVTPYPYTISEIDIDPISGHPVVTFFQICMIDYAIHKLTPCSSASFPMATATVVANNNSNGNCPGANLQLTAAGNGTAFTWTGPNGFTSNQQNPILPNSNNSFNGVYTVVSTGTNGTSSASTTVNFAAAVPAVVKITASVCEGGTATLESENSGASYMWSGPAGFHAIGKKEYLEGVNMLSAGMYTLYVYNQNGCPSIGTGELNVHAKPYVSIEMAKAQNGCAPLTKLEFAPIVNTNINSYAWDFGNGKTSTEQNPTNISMDNSGSYNVKLTVTNGLGCANTATKTLEAYPTPTSDFDFNTNVSYANPEVKFHDKSTNGNIISWDWTFGDNVNSFSKEKDPTFVYNEIGKYSVTLKVKTDKGCESSITRAVDVKEEVQLYVPSGFSPNGDGSNDVFQVVGTSIQKFDLSIFSRTGQLIYHTTEISKGWDGSLKGQQVPIGVYAYKIQYQAKDNDTKTLTGSITIVR